MCGRRLQATLVSVHAPPTHATPLQAPWFFQNIMPGQLRNSTQLRFVRENVVTYLPQVGGAPG